MIPRLDIHLTLTQLNAFVRGVPYCSSENEFLLDHARSGILLALRSLHLREGDEVGVMVYNCHTVFNAVAQAGCQPVFIDVTEGLSIDLDDLKTKANNLKALIVSHLFGIQNEISSIHSLYPHLPIIEDCAHAYGIHLLKGDFSVFSIGQGKLPSIGDGGILCVNNKVYLEEVRRLYAELPDYSFWDEVKLLEKLSLKSLFYRPFIYSFITEPIKRRKNYAGVTGIEPKKMSRGIRRVYEKEREQIVVSIEKRKHKAQSLTESTHIPGVTFFLGTNAFMLIAYSENLTNLKAFFMDQGIETATHFSHCIEWATSFGYHVGICPNAEYLINHLLMIPTYM